MPYPQGEPDVLLRAGEEGDVHGVHLPAYQVVQEPQNIPNKISHRQHPVREQAFQAVGPQEDRGYQQVHHYLQDQQNEGGAGLLDTSAAC